MMLKFVILFCIVSYCFFGCLSCDNLNRSKTIFINNQPNDLSCCNADSLSYKNRNETNAFNEFKTDYECLARNKYNIIDFWKAYPLTIMENSTDITLACSTAYNKYLKAIRENDFKAIKMFDATAKLSSGILKGNVNQYGDFDECLELEGAQYCLAEIDVEPLWRRSYLKFKDLVHSHFVIQETLNDPKHRVPGFTMIRWGFCIPKECSSRDLENSIREKLGAKSRVQPNMCQKLNKLSKLTYDDIFARSYFAILVALIISATTLYNINQCEKGSRY